MHDRAADPMGAATSATAVATEIMILLSIEARIAQVRLPVEANRSALLCSYRCFSARWPRNFTPCAHPFCWQFLRALCNNGDYNSLLNHQKTVMKDDNLQSIAKKLVAPGKGILAADESTGTIEKRLKSINVPSTEENRRAYREILFTTKDAGEFISGVILFDETIRQKTSDGRTFVKALEDQGIIPGIKVDKGAKAMANFPGEKITEGLDGLRERLAEYRELGARFAKWRAVISIGEAIPSEYCIWTNAHALARYAALSQEAGLVPIVEPEVLMDGDHTIERSFEVTSRTLHAVFTELRDQRVDPEDMLLKPNMVLSGYDGSEQASDQQIAELTLKCFRRHVPAAVPGIVFLSGGQSDEDATANLNAMNAMGPHPWQLSFSYGRALQAAALKAWGGKPENVEAAQRAYYHRAKMNSAARTGMYAPEMEREAVTA